ncbi:hypothetical protein VTL71DRAFT_9983, partial [Oculimacula yallundae]
MIGTSNTFDNQHYHDFIDPRFLSRNLRSDSLFNAVPGPEEQPQFENPDENPDRSSSLNFSLYPQQQASTPSLSDPHTLFNFDDFVNYQDDPIDVDDNHKHRGPPYVYKTCSPSETFPRQCELNPHIRTKHELPYKCRMPNCIFRFGYQKHLDRHRETKHSEAKEYFCNLTSCKYYEKGFSRKDNFKRHMKQHPGS